MWRRSSNDKTGRGLTDSQLADFQVARLTRLGRSRCRLLGIYAIAMVLISLFGSFALVTESPFIVLSVLVLIGLVSTIVAFVALGSLSQLERSQELYNGYRNQ